MLLLLLLAAVSSMCRPLASSRVFHTERARLRWAAWFFPVVCRDWNAERTAEVMAGEYFFERSKWQMRLVPAVC